MTAQFPLDGKTIVVTGATDGIGLAASRRFAELGANLVMVGRDEAKTAAAAENLNRAAKDAGPGNVSYAIADLSLQEAVVALASTLRAQHARIDVLVNNVGALFLDRELTADGLERTFALNHLSHFTLTLLLLDRIVSNADSTESSNAPGRIISVSSRAHRNARFDLNDLQGANSFQGMRAYANSKLCNILFARALAGRITRERGVVHALHPGVVSTSFALDNGFFGRVLRRLMDIVSVSPDEGADTIVWLSSADEALRCTGEYWFERKLKAPSRDALDDDSAEMLWKRSAKLAGIDADQLVRNAITGSQVHAR